MEATRKPQLLVRLTLFSVLFSRTLAWPLLEAPFLRIPFQEGNKLDQASLTLDTDILPSALAENDRNARHAEGVLTRDSKRLLGQLPAKRLIEPFIGERNSNTISEDDGRIERDEDNKITDQIAHIEIQAFIRKFLDKLRSESDAE